MYLIEEGKINNLYNYLLNIEKSYNFKRDDEGKLSYYTYKNRHKEDRINRYYKEMQYIISCNNDTLINEVIESYNREIHKYTKLIESKTEYLNKLKFISGQFKNWNLSTERGNKYKEKIHETFTNEITSLTDIIKIYNNAIYEIKNKIKTFKVEDYKFEMINYYNNQIKKENESINNNIEFKKNENEFLKDYEESLKELKEVTHIVKY